MSATTFLRHRNYAGDTCKNEEFPAATFGKAFCIFRYLGVAKNNFVRGSTALLDAVGSTVKKVENIQKRLPEEMRAENIIFVITKEF